MESLELNIDYHVKRLVLIAIGKYKTQKEQAKVLGITVRGLNKYLKRHNLNYQEIKRN